MSKYKLGSTSLKRLDGVDASLQAVFKRAIEITPVDFTILEGVRTPERQAALVDSGASQTMRSKHLTGHAVDAAPYVDGRIRWDWPLYYKLAAAVKQAAEELGVAVRWGGCWQYLADIDDPQEAVAAYAARKLAAGKKAFMDGPHFEVTP